MSGFNTSTRHSDDTSFKLKAQNLRNAKDQTKRLEIENIKMEDRLRELKFAMRREKEERERKGGGFWSKGQTGTLNNYATEVLEKTKPKKKEKGIKILKDEPIVIPERSSQPGTLKYIAQRPLDGKENKPKVLKCGQCEDRNAALSCQQCSEHYCTRCFAAFHIKGALKKHRSIPITAMGPRQSMSPRPVNSYREYDSARNVSVVGAMSSRSNYQDWDQNGPDGVSGSYDGPSLMSGIYNESESAASFQQALIAWRSGDTDQSPGRQALGTKKPSPRKIVVSPIKSPVFSIESSTSTTSDARSPDIHFHSDVSYAERLLLKKHRRTELPPIQSAVSVTPTNDRTGSAGSRYQDDMDYEPVSFTALYQASCIGGQSPRQPRRVESGLSIIELDATSSRQHPASMEYSDRYQVEEVEPYQAWEVENLRKALSAVKSPSETSVDGKPPARGPRSARKQSKKSSVSKEEISVSSFSSDTSLSLSSRNSKQETNYNQSSARRNVGSMQNRGDGKMNVVFTNNDIEPELQFSQSQSRTQSRAVSSRSRPSSARVKSSKSRTASRLSSRARSRNGEGVLTKAPNESLREVASRLGHTEVYTYNSPMKDFFTMGVKSEFQERTVTPSSSKKTKESSYKVSHKLYKMAPCSWKPENSLETNLPPDSVSVEISEALLQGTASGLMDEQTSEFTPASEVHSRSSSRVETPRNENRDWNTPPPLSRQITAESQRLRNPTEPVEQPHSFDSRRLSTPEVKSTTRQNSNLARSRQETRESQRLKTPTEQQYSFDSRTLSTPEANGTTRQNSNLPMIRQDMSESQRLRNTPEPVGRHSLGSERLPTPELKSKTRHSSNLSMSRQDTQESKRLKQNPSEPVERQSHDSERSSTPEVKSRNGYGSNRPSSRQDRRPASRAAGDGRTSRVGGEGRTSRVAGEGRTSRVTGDGRNSQVGEDGRISRAIVVDGEDMSKYDDADCEEMQTQEDNETLDQLEWELASQSGRLTADGQISRLSGLEDLSRSVSSQDSTPTGQSYDLGTKLRLDEFSDETDENDNKILDTEDVKALH
ncbi:zinc finger B-box domain-containing protein 1-like isoform X2 [Gigantopelta aegis]|uniref:zinc finger B-box domain-containing protein 1-like isoform X2 n=1 Tax=Gigantopelta aegis TaxID=1735272 RepID=UPI001B88882A|nr:zinc finger B-box domain-containing protein 1-like isoform X2 [Gigantopelta aegis]